MSLYLKVIPAVLLEPDVLLCLGRKICSIVRDSLILDRRMEEICLALEREGRTFGQVIARNNTSAITANLDEAAVACEKSCSLLKAGIQLNLLNHDEQYRIPAHLLQIAIELHGNDPRRQESTEPGNRIRNIIATLETEQMLKALQILNLQRLFEDLKNAFQKFEAILAEKNRIHEQAQMPSLQSTIALYGMLVDTLIANVRFENYQLLHRVESVLMRIETAVKKAMEINIERQREERHYMDLDTAPEPAVA